LEAVIDRVWRCIGKPRSSEIGDALVAGYNPARLEKDVEVVDPEAAGGRRIRR
jgi:hypothetical protein